MLDWLTGNGRSTQSVGSAKDCVDVPEPPQTPAPVFAVRAFKTALFGTPQETREKDVTAAQQDVQTIAGRNDPKTDKVAPNGVIVTKNRPPLGRADANANQPAVGVIDAVASPLKPPGIMLTPGAGPSRRKTVSFGASVLDNEERRSFRARRAEVTEESSAASSNLRKSNAEATATQSGRTRLTKTLYELRDQIRDEDDEENRPHQHQSEEGSTKLPATDVEDLDITVDMDKPRSTSGRYWKSEFENYQEEAEQAINRLKKYRQMAKSYVRQKDSEAMSLGAKLHDESQKVKRLEAEISDLAASLSSSLAGDHGNELDQAQLAKKLASQTSLALEYQRKIYQLQALPEENDHLTVGNNGPKTNQGTSPRTAETLLQTRQELKKARKQVQEINELRIEVGELRSKASDAEKRAEKLEEENISLTKELARTRERLKEMEKQRNVQEDNGGKSAYKKGGDRIHHSEGTGGEGKIGHQTLKVELAMNSGEGTGTPKPHAVSRNLRRVSLPPERAAAAMARLEQRKAERKRLRMQERKEDIAGN